MERGLTIGKQTVTQDGLCIIATEKKGRAEAQTATGGMERMRNKKRGQIVHQADREKKHAQPIAIHHTPAHVR